MIIPTSRELVRYVLFVFPLFYSKLDFDHTYISGFLSLPMMAGFGYVFYHLFRCRLLEPIFCDCCARTMLAFQRGLALSPLAIRISFTAKFPLETCKQRLLDRQVTPSKWNWLFGASQLVFKFSSMRIDLYEFEAQRQVRRTVIHAKGYLQKIEHDVTAIVGYADAKISFYVLLILVLVIGIITAVSIYNGTSDGLYISSAIVLMFFASTFINALIARREAKKLVLIIEEILSNNP